MAALQGSGFIPYVVIMTNGRDSVMSRGMKADKRHADLLSDTHRSCHARGFLSKHTFLSGHRGPFRDSFGSWALGLLFLAAYRPADRLPPWRSILCPVAASPADRPEDRAAFRQSHKKSPKGLFSPRDQIQLDAFSITLPTILI